MIAKMSNYLIFRNNNNYIIRTTNALVFKHRIIDIEGKNTKLLKLTVSHRYARLYYTSIKKCTTNECYKLCDINQ